MSDIRWKVVRERDAAVSALAARDRSRNIWYNAGGECLGEIDDCEIAKSLWQKLANDRADEIATLKEERDDLQAGKDPWFRDSDRRANTIGILRDDLSREERYRAADVAEKNAVIKDQEEKIAKLKDNNNQAKLILDRYKLLF